MMSLSRDFLCEFNKRLSNVIESAGCILQWNLLIMPPVFLPTSFLCVPAFNSFGGIIKPVVIANKLVECAQLIKLF